ncbi:hypothetical protein FOZ63_028828 [Perkinsus olseni]|uniref:PDZ domain-containing protein n=1 Tax=Perkinsus olseni TaxID=32597 RepID=A0A7J6U8B6_PEROL|nr:hypothetical protein FOZ63_028828 [Perkinsus olseni]
MKEIAAELRVAGLSSITVQLIRCVDGVAAEVIERRPRALSRPPPLLPAIPTKLPSSTITGQNENLMETDGDDDRVVDNGVDGPQSDWKTPPTRAEAGLISRSEMWPAGLESRLSVPDDDGAEERTVEGEGSRIVARRLLRACYIRACQQSRDTNGSEIAPTSAAKEMLLQLYHATSDRPVHFTLSRESRDMRWGLSLANPTNAAALVVAAVVEDSPAWASDGIGEGDGIIAARAAVVQEVHRIGSLKGCCEPL